jgi:hypothetical protein
MRVITSGILSLAVALAAAPGAAARQAAAPSRKATVDVRLDATVAGQRLERGTYQVELVDGAEPVLVLSKNRREVARLRVDRKDLEFESPYDQVSYTTAEGGGREVVAITFKKGREAFVVSGLAQVANATEP